MTLLTAHRAMQRELEYAAINAAIANSYSAQAYRATRRSSKEYYTKRAEYYAAFARECIANAIGFASI